MKFDDINKVQRACEALDEIISELKHNNRSLPDDVAQRFDSEYDKSEFIRQLIEHQDEMTRIYSQCKADIPQKQRLDVRLRGSNKFNVYKSLVKITAVAAMLVVGVVSWNLIITDESESKNNIVTPLLAYSYTEPVLIVNDTLSMKFDEHTLNKMVNKEEQKNGKGKLTAPTLCRLIVPVQCTQMIVLDDGTEVTLNANSELSFPEKFTGKTREVGLKGEAYFKVAKSDVPFIVNANESYVKVYGTEFGINTQLSNKIRTVLVEGRVGISLSTSAEEKIMAPNEMLEIDILNRTMTLEKVDVMSYLAWMNGSFEYLDGDFDDIINNIANWYGVVFKYNAEHFDDVKLTLAIAKDVSLDASLQKLQLAMNIDVIQLNDKTYEIVKK
ncbi:MAG: FecR family protein [Marinifilaceae bacterium]